MVVGSLIDIRLDPESVKNVKEKLQGTEKKIPAVIKNALNATAKKTKKDLASRAQARYTIKTAKFNKNIKRQNASVSKLEAKLIVSGRANPLENFQYRKNTRRLGAKARGKVDSNLKELISTSGGRAFVVTFSSGHTAIAQRESSARLPIKGFYGPSDPVMIGSRKVYGELEPQIQQHLQDEIKKQIRKITGGR